MVLQQTCDLAREAYDLVLDRSICSSNRPDFIDRLTFIVLLRKGLSRLEENEEYTSRSFFHLPVVLIIVVVFLLLSLFLLLLLYWCLLRGTPLCVPVSNGHVHTEHPLVFLEEPQPHLDHYYALRSIGEPCAWMMRPSDDNDDDNDDNDDDEDEKRD
uniref:Uncharacterized protein n=1 Tax=Vespula pensylvanica TaxID=30213 RepID=A0A834K4V2_VESPE|nr:hypothetical protein H0235_015845 [Vespula pensylvanica]